MINGRRKLIFLWHYLDWGGAQIYFLAIIKEAQKDWDVTVVLPRKSSAEIVKFIEDTGVKCEFIDVWLDNSPAATLTQKLKRQWRRIHAEIYSFFYLRKFDLKNSVVHAESAPWQSWLFYAALAVRSNVFVTVHNALPQTSGWRGKLWKLRLRFLTKFAGFHVFTANRDAKNNLKNYVGEGVWNKITVTYASVNVPEINLTLARSNSRKSVYEKLGLPADRFVVLCAGQFVDRKGRWIFLDAARRVSKLDREIAFVWLMPNLPDEETQKKINEYQSAGFFYAVLSAAVGNRRIDILEFIKFADLYALPSLVEGLPISLLEAMALKKACIATRINAIPEAVTHLQNGWLINSGSADELTAAILHLKNDRKLMENLGQNAHSAVVKNFSESETARFAIAEYQRCFKK